MDTLQQTRAARRSLIRMISRLPSRVFNVILSLLCAWFRSTDARRDGRYRRLSIKINRSDVKLEYRAGYYAPADFQHSNKDDRERELEEQLASDLPATDVAVYLQALYSAWIRSLLCTCLASCSGLADSFCEAGIGIRRRSQLLDR